MDGRAEAIDAESGIIDDPARSSVPVDRDRDDQQRNPATRSRATIFAREIVWAVLTIAFAIYLGTGRVSTYLGAAGRGRAGVWDVWQNLVGDLPGGDSVFLRVGYVVVLIAFVGGFLVALWLALAADGSDESTERPIADAP